MAEAPLTRAHVLNVVLTYAAVASLCEQNHHIP